jgi:hypothetical protein
MILLKGKSAKRFIEEIENKTMSKKQRQYLDECVDLVESTKCGVDEQ